MKSVRQRRSVGELASLPIVMMTVGAFLGTLYGGCSSDFAVITVNAMGSLIGLYSVWIYSQFSSGKRLQEVRSCISDIITSVAPAIRVGWDCVPHCGNEFNPAGCTTSSPAIIRHSGHSLLGTFFCITACKARNRLPYTERSEYIIPYGIDERCVLNVVATVWIPEE